MVEASVIKIDDKDYVIIKEIAEYVYLVNKLDEKDLLIRKNVVIDGVDYLEKLDSEEELRKSLELYKNNS